MAIGLAFDPPTRATRLSYLSSRMSVYAYRGVDVDQVRAKFAASAEETSKDLNNIDLMPANGSRLLGANQAARKDWVGPWDKDEHPELVVVVRNTQRWPYPADEPIRYALAVALEVSEALPELYSELSAQLDVLAEIESEIELG